MLFLVPENIKLSLSFDDVLLIPQYSKISSRNDVNLKSRISSRIELQIPIITANMSDVVSVEMAIKIAKLGGLGVIPRFKSIEEQADEISKVKKEKVIVGAAIGARNGIVERAEAVVKAGADILFIDVAHGHMLKTIEATKKLKSLFGKKVDIVAGNIATYSAAKDLYKAGADAVKVGIGPGSICTTRIETGSGVPQVSAILEAARAARSQKKYLIADGGIKNSGDMVKALAAGASAVMLGSMLAGHDESPGKLVTRDGKKYKQYNASTSLTEKEKHVENNGKEVEKHYVKQIEGVESLVPYKGKLENSMTSWAANMRSGFSYSGTININELWKRAQFTQITASGMRESMPHDVLVNREK